MNEDQTCDTGQINWTGNPSGFEITPSYYYSSPGASYAAQVDPILAWQDEETTGGANPGMSDDECIRDFFGQPGASSNGWTQMTMKDWGSCMETIDVYLNTNSPY